MTSATEDPQHPAGSRQPAPPAGSAGAGQPSAGAWAQLGDLAELAAEFGVATSYEGQDGGLVTVAPEAVRAVLALLGVDPADPARALADARAARWRRVLPSCAVLRAAAPAPVEAHVPADAPAPSASVELADGGTAPAVVRLTGAEEVVDGRLVRAASVDIPADLPLGDHRLLLRAGATVARCALIVVPDAVPDVLRDGAGDRRAWGWMIQLYALASAGSWGIGDYADLAMIAQWSGRDGADVLLVNPLHAAAPTFPVEPSPYSPSSRRFVSPLYLRPELLPEYVHASAGVRAEVDGLAERARREGIRDGLIDRDAVWRAKLPALELLFTDHHEPDDGATAAPARGSGPDGGLADFALWCALAERHGRDWRTWPEELRDPAGPAVEVARAELADRVAFHAWLQRRCDDQLAAAQATARAAGMRVGIVHDLAVGVEPGGADAWAMRGVLATGASVGAPPDGFNQQGQDWGLPPWRPTVLAESGYAAFRAMVRAVLARGGGVRVDHILGLFRLWWVPGGAGAAAGTFVRYDAAAMLGLLALEARHAGALIVGEDLGTVEDSVAVALDHAGIFGSSVLWFERSDDGAPRHPGEYRVRSMASVTTHDLPTAAGFLDGEHVRVREELGLLARSGAQERAAWLAERADLLRLLADEGLLTAASADADVETAAAAEAEVAEVGAVRARDLLAPAVRDEAAFGLHALLGLSRARVVLLAPGDAFGDPRQPNLPGTVDSYPNWRLPVVDGAGERVTVERLLTDPRPRRLITALGELGKPGKPGPGSPEQGGPRAADPEAGHTPRRP
ncbi:4-alpha-glucanotransferase [Parafrankia sp. FMc2]|uniref:4-alpha-glucanotransferase n=1 Tax=Parafrankia sp. FMc2 TaxID=3233196 RepID=UPI0034D73745